MEKSEQRYEHNAIDALWESISRTSSSTRSRMYSQLFILRRSMSGRQKRVCQALQIYHGTELDYLIWVTFYFQWRYEVVCSCRLLWCSGVLDEVHKTGRRRTVVKSVKKCRVHVLSKIGTRSLDSWIPITEKYVNIGLRRRARASLSLFHTTKNRQNCDPSILERFTSGRCRQSDTTDSRSQMKSNSTPTDIPYPRRWARRCKRERYRTEILFTNAHLFFDLDGFVIWTCPSCTQ